MTCATSIVDKDENMSACRSCRALNSSLLNNVTCGEDVDGITLAANAAEYFVANASMEGPESASTPSTERIASMKLSVEAAVLG